MDCNLNNILKYSDSPYKMSGYYDTLLQCNLIPKNDINETILSNYKKLQQKRKNDISNEIVILALGDISLTRDIEKYNIKNDKGQFIHPFKYVKKYLRDSDITIGNLETLITTKGSPYSLKSPELQFRSLPSSINSLLDSGINIVNISNNHCNDFNKKGIIDSAKYIKNVGIDVIGLKDNIIDEINSYKIFHIKGIKICFIGITRPFKKLKKLNIINILDNNNKNIINLIKNKRNEVDILIVSIHWGTEYSFTKDKYQDKTSDLLIDNGVDIILGHHPHTIQKTEIKYSRINKNHFGYVFYSLGNFVFDSHVKKSGVRNTFILKIIIDTNILKDIINKKKIKNIKQNPIRFEYLPCIIYPNKGFSPIPVIKSYQTIYPKLYTKKGDDLYKYIKCAKTASCKEGFTNNNNNNNVLKYNHFNNKLILIPICVLILFIIIKTYKLQIKV